MRSNAKKTFYFHADANSLGGFIDKPFQKAIPSQAAISLPPVGGHATARSDAFNFEEIISCRAAYTKVSGSLVAEGGAGAVLVTSVVEGLNILEVVKAERIVAQIAVEHSGGGGFSQIHFTGSSCEGLKIGGHDASPTFNTDLLESVGGTARKPVDRALFQQTGQQQAAKLKKAVADGAKPNDYSWLVDRYGWMDDASRDQAKDGFLLCSLVNGVNQEIPGRSFAHVLDIPEFGRIFLGEVMVFPARLQLSMIRAELGCSTGGGGNGPTVGVGIHTIPP
jgi:hypothetical protein